MARTTKGYGIKDDARRSHIDIGDGEWAEIYYEGLGALDAGRRGRQIRRIQSATKQPDISAFVSTSANVYFDLSTTRSLVQVTSLTYGVHTVSDNVQIEIGYTATAGGVGTFTALSNQFGYQIGSSHVGKEQGHETFWPPLVARYTADDARSVTLRITVNDTSAEVHAGWAGFYETEQ